MDVAGIGDAGPEGSVRARLRAVRPATVLHGRGGAGDGRGRRTMLSLSRFRSGSRAGGGGGVTFGVLFDVDDGAGAGYGVLSVGDVVRAVGCAMTTAADVECVVLPDARCCPPSGRLVSKPIGPVRIQRDPFLLFSDPRHCHIHRVYRGSERWRDERVGDVGRDGGVREVRRVSCGAARGERGVRGWGALEGADRSCSGRESNFRPRGVVALEGVGAFPSRARLGRRDPRGRARGGHRGRRRSLWPAQAGRRRTPRHPARVVSSSSSASARCCPRCPCRAEHRPLRQRSGIVLSAGAHHASPQPSRRSSWTRGASR